jgi:hypothetical protein
MLRATKSLPRAGTFTSTLALVTSLSLVAPVVAPSVALAVPPRAGGAHSAWQQHFEAGRQAFEAGQFEDAAESFYRARETGGPASLLFNQGLALDRMGRGPAAAAAYRRYLEESETAPNRADVESRIAELEMMENNAPTLTMEMMPLEAGAMEQVVVGEGRPVIRAQRQVPEVHEYGPTWTVSWFLLVGTLGAAAGAIGVWVDGQNTFNLLREDCLAMNGCAPSLIAESSAHTSELVTNILFVSSGVLGLATVISFLAEGAATSGTDIYVDLTPTGVMLRGSF